jgi:lysophospholipase L1-like esterase
MGAGCSLRGSSRFLVPLLPQGVPEAKATSPHPNTLRVTSLTWEKNMNSMNQLWRTTVVGLLFASSAVFAEPPWTLSNDTRYLSMGDSLAAGYGAIPTTQGYAYLLYQGGTFDKITNTIFANAAVPGVTSQQVLQWQVPAAVTVFQPDAITISVGGNDLLQILAGGDAGTILTNFQNNLIGILCGLRAGLPDAIIIVGNQYDIPEITANIPGSRQVILVANQIIAGVAQACGAKVADVFNAFEGRTGLLLIERHGADPFQVHPTNAGYRMMAKAFEYAASH